MKKEFKQTQIDALALEIFKQEKAEGTPVTMEEAQEMAKMELNAKQISRYEKSDTPKKKGVRVKKVDPIKREIITTITNNLCRCWFDELGDDQSEPHFIQVTNPEKYIDFFVGSDHYTITLTKHRAPK